MAHIKTLGHVLLSSSQQVTISAVTGYCLSDSIYSSMNLLTSCVVLRGCFSNYKTTTNKTTGMIIKAH